MTGISFSEYFVKLKATVEGALQLASAAGVPGSQEEYRLLQQAYERIQTDSVLRVVLIGEYSAGKSSLVKALTGADVLIDADVATTDIAEFAWRGLSLVDTPGVQSDNVSTDHDRISREATIGADLVLFVVTNELFSPKLAGHLHYIIDESGLGLGRKTAVIVNKIDRESNNDEVILSEVRKVLGTHDLPVFLCAASRFNEAQNHSSERRERFIRQSRVGDLVEGINHFVNDAGALARIVTPLQQAMELLDVVEKSLVASNDDKNELELLRRNKRIVQDLEKRLREVRKTWKAEVYSSVLRQANEAVEEIDEITDEAGLRDIFQSGLGRAVTGIEQIYEEVVSDVSAAMQDAEDALAELGSSALAIEVGKVKGKRESARDGPALDAIRPDSGNFGKRFLRDAAKSKEVSKLFEQAAKNGKGLRDAIYKAGKSLGVKFRPHEAMKLGKGAADILGKVGKSLPFLAFALDSYLQYREEKVKEEKARYLATMRNTLRNAFAEQAKIESGLLEQAIQEMAGFPVSETLEGIDAEAAALAKAGTGRAELMHDVSALKQQCTLLRSKLYAAEPALQAAE